MRTLAKLSATFVASISLLGCGGSTPPPSASTTGASYPETVRVTVAHDGTTTFDGDKVDPAELTARTREAARQQPHLKLLVDAERETSFQLVMSAVERIKAGGGTNVGFGTIVAASAPATSTEAAAPAAKGAHPVTGPTLASHASVPTGTKWDCPFPTAAERSGKREANVLVRVHVENDGKPLSVDVLEDPGSGFAEAAKTCALGKAYEAARDVNGQPIRATTFPFYIQFVTK